MPFKDNPAATCASIVNIFVALEAKTQKKPKRRRVSVMVVIDGKFVGNLGTRITEQRLQVF